MTKMKLIKKKLGLEVIPFFEEELLLGDKFNFANLSKGIFTLYHPPMIDKNRIHDFKSGGHAHDFYQSNPPREIAVKDKVYSAQKVPDLENNLHLCIASFFEQKKVKQCFIHEILTPEGSGFSSIIREGDCYEAIEACDYKQLSANKLSEFISGIYLNWHFMCVGTSTKTEPSGYGWKDIIKKEKENIYFIVIAIYDGEGFIVWEKQHMTT